MPGPSLTRVWRILPHYGPGQNGVFFPGTDVVHSRVGNCLGTGQPTILCPRGSTEALNLTAMWTKGIVTDGCLESCSNARKRFIWLIWSPPSNRLYILPCGEFPEWMRHIHLASCRSFLSLVVEFSSLWPCSWSFVFHIFPTKESTLQSKGSHHLKKTSFSQKSSFF